VACEAYPRPYPGPYPGKRVLRRHWQIIGRSTRSHGWRSRKSLTRRENLARCSSSSVITPL
jgi:hypothetical protein